jgi:hypothetical protein
VRHLDHGVAAGVPFLVLELLEGEPLDRVIEQRGTLSPRVALAILDQILGALEEAHRLGVVHRDLKPQNVFITSRFGQPPFAKLLDFGIAKQTRGGAPLTALGEAIGTPSYMAPEQTLGGAVDARTDVYAAGLLLAEMVTGKPVFDRGGPMTILVAQAKDEPVPLSREVLASFVGALVQRAVQKRPEDRFPSAEAMREATLATLAEVDATGAAPTRVPEPARETPPTMKGVPAHLTIASAPAELEAAPPPIAPSTTSVSGSGAWTPPPAPPVSHGTAIPAPPRRPPKATPALSGVAIAIIAALSLAVVVLLARELGRDDDAREAPGPGPTAPPVEAPEERPHPRVRRARTTDVAELRRLLRGGGYAIVSDGGSGTTHSFAVQRLPCSGSVTKMDLSDAEQARSTATMIAERDPGMIYLLEGRTMISVGIVRTGGAQGADIGCTEPVAALLAAR